MFLDEIGDISPRLQQVLLRSLKTGRFSQLAQQHEKRSMSGLLQQPIGTWKS